MRKALMAGLAGMTMMAAATQNAAAQSVPIALVTPATCSISGNWYFASGTNRGGSFSPSGLTHNLGSSLIAVATGLPVFTGSVASTAGVNPGTISGSSATRYRAKAMCNAGHTVSVTVSPVLGPGGTPPAGFNNRIGLQANAQWTSTTGGGLTGTFPTQGGAGTVIAGTATPNANAWASSATTSVSTVAQDAYIDVRLAAYIPSALANTVYPGENPQTRRLVGGTYSGAVTLTLTP